MHYFVQLPLPPTAIEASNALEYKPSALDNRWHCFAFSREVERIVQNPDQRALSIHCFLSCISLKRIKALQDSMPSRQIDKLISGGIDWYFGCVQFLFIHLDR